MDKQDDEPVFEQLDTNHIQQLDMEKKEVIVKGVDDALLFTIERQHITWTAEEERRLLWKIDLRLIPLVR
jgi:ACS family allantoate permease-like MFS transporter